MNCDIYAAHRFASQAHAFLDKSQWWGKKKDMSSGLLVECCSCCAASKSKMVHRKDCAHFKLLLDAAEMVDRCIKND